MEEKEVVLTSVEQFKEYLKNTADKPLAKVEEREEQNYNMIDNVINNLPQNPEEKKEPAPQKEMRIAAFLAWLLVFLFYYLTPCQNTYIIYFDTESE